MTNVGVDALTWQLFLDAACRGTNDVTAKDPTDQALAMIASILETPARPVAKRSG